MKPNMNLQYYLDVGILLITVVNAAGAIASRKFNFRFQYLILLSITIYTTTGFLIAKDNTLIETPLCNAIFGCFDVLMGWHFSKVLMANTGYSGNEQKRFSVQAGMLMKVV